MNITEILDDIKKNLTGDPQKDGPFLKAQSEKYKEHENYIELNRELGRLLYEIAHDDYFSNMQAFLAQENPKTEEQLQTVHRKYKNLNFTGGMEILEEIIKNNLFAWLDTEEITYKSFGTPIEHAIYLQIYEPEKEIHGINCHLSEVYMLYGVGLTKKERFKEALKAFETALEFNPVDAGILLEYSELLKTTRSVDELKDICDRALMCAVTKEQLGRAYFNYAFYFCEMKKFEKAAMMLEMSRIFYNSKVIDTEIEYITKCTGAKPRRHTAQELSKFLEAEKIQPGPSVLVVQSAYKLGIRAEQQLDYKLAKYYFETVLELTEEDAVRDHISDLERTIKDLKDIRQG